MSDCRLNVGISADLGATRNGRVAGPSVLINNVRIIQLNICSDAQHDSFDGSPLILLLLNCQWRGLQKQDYTKCQGFHTRRYFVIKFTSKVVLPESETLAGVPDCS